MSPQQLYIACYGNLADGFTFVGPFRGRRSSYRPPDAWLPLAIGKNSFDHVSKEPRFIVIAGNAIGGFLASGPFANKEDAHACGGGDHGEWVIAELFNVGAQVVRVVLDLGKEAA